MRAGEDRPVAWPALGPRGCQVVWARPVMPPDARLDDGVRERLAALAREEDRRRHATGAVLSDALARVHGGAGARVVRRRGEAPRVVVGAVGGGAAGGEGRASGGGPSDGDPRDGGRADGGGTSGADPRVVGRTDGGGPGHVAAGGGSGDGPELYVSVAHGGAWVVVAVCAFAPVGVDVEPVGRGFEEELVEQVLAPVERDGEGVLVAWVRKEAVVKATGDGLRVEPREVVVSVGGERPRVLAYPGRPELVGSVAIADVAPDREHVGAVAVLAPEPVTLAVLDAAVLLGDAPS